MSKCTHAEVLTTTLIEPDYSKDILHPIPHDVQAYVKWFQAAYGWNPFGAVQCFECKQPIHPMQVFRCYDCKAAMCHLCCMVHGGESREYIQSRLRT